MSDPILRAIGIVDVRFGRNVTVVEPANLYQCSIGDESFVGPFVEIQRDVTIGTHCRIQSHAFICEQVTIGNHCFISHGAKFINDRFADGAISRHPGGWTPTTLGDRVLVGTNATVLPVRICSDVVIGAGAVVTRDISTPGVYAGNPARWRRQLRRSNVSGG